MVNVESQFIVRGGRFVYTTRQTVAMTVNLDIVTLTVPTGKRWYIQWLKITNDSGQNITCYGVVRGTGGQDIATLYNQAINNGDYIMKPWVEGTQGKNELGHGAYPVILEGGMDIKLNWSALAGKAGSSYYFFSILEVDL